MAIWWDKSITLIEGCTPVSEGCAHCWSAGMAHRFHGKKGLTTNGHFNGKIVCREDRFGEILRCKKPTRWTIWNDLFHDSIPNEFRWDVHKIIEKCPQHIFQILTKRIHIARAFYYANKDVLHSNIWLGVTAENQEMADKRIPILLQIPAAVRFVSIEPMLGPVDIEDKYLVDCYSCGNHNSEAIFGSNPAKQGGGLCSYACPKGGQSEQLDWVIVGGESGPKRRECKLEWIEDVVNQCKSAGVKCFVKQIPLNGKVCKDINLFPKRLQFQEYPNQL